MVTRFMQAMFSATDAQDEELVSQVANDVEAAKENGSVDTDEVSYVNLGSGKVLVTDKANGESTVVEQDEENPEEYSLEGFENDEELEKYLHTLDGITPDESVRTEEFENVEDHMAEGEDWVNAYDPQTVYENAEGEDEEECEECQKGFSLTSYNSAIVKVFSDQDFYYRLFADVVTEEKPAVVGDLKIEVDEDAEDSVIVTDLETGDSAKVTLDENGQTYVSELQKEASDVEDEDYEDEDEDDECCHNGEEFDPIFVVGLDPEEHVLVNATSYDPEDAEELAQRLAEDGVEGVEIFDDQDEARDHAADLLGEVGVSEVEELAEPEEHTFSDYTTVYTTRYFSSLDEDDVTSFMMRMFSEEDDENPATQNEIEDALESGEQVEDDEKVITPVDSETAVVMDKDNDEFTKVTINGEDMDLEKISEEEADDLTKDLEADPEGEDEDEEDEEEEKEFSDFELRYFSNDDVAEEVHDAIESGEQIENNSEVITPVDGDTAVVYDKDSEEYTKVTTDGETEVISEDEADDLTGDLSADGDEDDEDEDEDEDDDSDYEDEDEEEEDEKKFSTLDRFFADVEEQVNPGQAPVEGNPEIDPETGDPIEEEEVIAEGQPAGSVEGIEDKALAAVQSIQAAANDAVLAIQEAKEAPAPGEEQDLREAQFCDFSDDFSYDIPIQGNTLATWLANNN